MIRPLQLGAQAVGLVVVSAAPVWIEKLADRDSEYLYLLTDARYLWQIMAVMFALVLLPQLGAVTGFALRGTISTCFYVAGAIVRKGRLLALVLLLGPIAVAIGLASLAQGLAAYGFSLYRQHHYTGEISRQVAVENVNKLDREGGPLVSAPALKVLVERYPLDPRNGNIQDRLDDIAAAREVAAGLDQEAEAMTKAGFHFRALELYRTALEVFSYDTQAGAAVEKYKREFENQRAQLAAFYELCGDRSPEAIAKAVPLVTLLFWDPDAVVQKLSDSDPAERERGVATACTRTISARSSTDFTTILHDLLFGQEA